MGRVRIPAEAADRTCDRAAGFAMRRAPARSRRGLYLRVGLFLLAAAALTGTGWWLRTSPTFAVKKVESGAYRFTSQQQLEEAFGSLLGASIWTLSGETVADTLAPLPWVRDLQVRRRLPASLKIDFREWRPLLLLDGAAAGRPSSARPLVVVEDGRVLEFPDHLVVPGLPVLVGVPCRRDSVRGELCLDPSQRRQVLDLVAAIENSGLETVNPVDFIVARREGFAIVLQKDRGTLLVGRDEFDRRLDRYMTAREHLESGLQMDLRFADRITCRRI